MSDKTISSYDQILKSSSMMGGAQGISLLLGMVRTKFVAMLIGPLGVGLLDTYLAIQGMVWAVAGLGIQASAVRDVAVAAAKDDEETIGRTVLSLQRICWVTGILGALAMVALAIPLSYYTFESKEHAWEISFLGVIILLGSIQGGQMAFIQGMHRIGDLARLTIIGAVTGTIVSITLYAWLGLQGIIPALLLLALFQLIASWYFARRIPVAKVVMTWRESFELSRGMVRLGLAFMWDGILVTIVAYLTRAFITQEISLEAVGIFSAAFALSGLFIRFIISAMAADFYPRLTAFSNDHIAMKQMVNEQMEIGLLLAVPGLLATLSLAPWIIRLFYTNEFILAADLLQWFILGCLGQVIAWPMGYIILAKGKSGWFFFQSTLLNVFHLGIIWLALVTVGLEGVAIAYPVFYAFFLIVVYGITHYLIGFCWSSAIRRLILQLLPVVVLTFLVARFLPLWPATGMGVVLTAAASFFCLRGLIQRIGHDHLIVQKLFRVPGMRRICN